MENSQWFTVWLSSKNKPSLGELWRATGSAPSSRPRLGTSCIAPRSPIAASEMPSHLLTGCLTCLSWRSLMARQSALAAPPPAKHNTTEPKSDLQQQHFEQSRASLAVWPPRWACLCVTEETPRCRWALHRVRTTSICSSPRHEPQTQRKQRVDDALTAGAREASVAQTPR